MAHKRTYFHAFHTLPHLPFCGNRNGFLKVKLTLPKSTVRVYFISTDSYKLLTFVSSCLKRVKLTEVHSGETGKVDMCDEGGNNNNKESGVSLSQQSMSVLGVMFRWIRR